MKAHFVYVLVDPREPDHIRYVGITVNPRKRMTQHLRSLKQKNKKVSWVKSLLAENIEPEMRVMGELDTHNKACGEEIALISKYKELGHKLTNLTSGGDGSIGLKGAKRSPETRKRISEALKGKKKRRTLLLSPIVSEETRRKMSLQKKGKEPWNKGKPGKSPANVKKIKDQYGNVYESLTEAARKLKLRVSHISLVLKGLRPHTGGYTFQSI